ncbi:MAG TPA: glutamine-hydrolyzing GMP synthase [Terriglobales bacterium]|nr:glutamine-hydrolyzing GMP synthase [Terriglobales bacterium]
MKHQLILVMDFGGQYNQLIARRVRDFGVYSEVYPCTITPEEIKKLDPAGIIFTGGPASVLAEGSPRCDKAIFDMGIPILGICYGAQLIGKELGGSVAKPKVREYGRKELELKSECPLFEGVPKNSVVWMSHTDLVDKLPQGFVNVGQTNTCVNTAFMNCEKQIYGLQFHPEVTHTEYGLSVLRGFVFDVCKCTADWQMAGYVDEFVAKIKAQVGDSKVLCALSGGVDSAVSAVLVSKAVGKQLTCMFVDTGLMRKNEGEEVEKAFREQYDINFIRIDAEERFLSKLAGVTDPEAKRKIIGEEFIRVFEDEGKKLGHYDYLVQGTIYPDVIESGLGIADKIKSHHNVAGLPAVIDFKDIIEPLRMLFKDEVRKLGEILGMPEHLVWRQPFPGPGLGIRVIGDVDKAKLDILREADAIFREEVANFGLHRQIQQYFVVMTGIRSVGVLGDERSYDYTAALRAVTTTDFMSADWARLPLELIEKVSNRIVNEVKHINRVVYDVTSKPPATIEWE